jgi:cytochrome c peroxidase
MRPFGRHLAAAGAALACFVSTGVIADFRPFQPLPAQPPVPAENAMSSAKEALGKQLFFDPRLSPDGSLACNSCHNVLAGGDDGRRLSVGYRGMLTRRNAPTLWNVGFYTIYFRDGRATSLEHAVEEQLISSEAMAMASPEAVTSRVDAIQGYREQFAAVFGDEHAVSFANVAKAVSAYLRTLVTQDSPFDQYLRGHKSALSASAQRGFDLYVETGCASCHFWVGLAGPIPGLAFQMGEGFYELFPNYRGSDYESRYGLAEDIGRFSITAEPTDQHMWRVTGLRNVALTAPYFHNGAVATLDEAVRVMAQVQLKKTLNDQEVRDVVEFLHTLTGTFPAQTLPRLPAAADGAVYSPP